MLTALNCDESLSNVAFNFKLRRYMMVWAPDKSAYFTLGGAVQVETLETHFESAWFKRLS